MKKFIMAAFMAVVSMTASAQVYVGGNIGFSTASEKATENAESVSGTLFTLRPEVGYYFNDSFAAGLRFGLGYVKAGSLDKTTYDGELYARYDFLKAGSFTLGGELGLGIQTYGKDAGAGFIVALRPVAQWAVSDSFSFIGRANLLEYIKNNKDAGKGSSFGFGILNGNSTVELGIQVKF